MYASFPFTRKSSLAIVHGQHSSEVLAWYVGGSKEQLSGQHLLLVGDILTTPQHIICLVA